MVGDIWTRQGIIWKSRTSLQSVCRFFKICYWRSASIVVTLLVLRFRFSVHWAERHCTISSWLMRFASRGAHTEEASCMWVNKNYKYKLSLMQGDQIFTFPHMTPNAQVCLMCSIHLKPWLMTIPRYFAVSSGKCCGLSKCSWRD